MSSVAISDKVRAGLWVLLCGPLVFGGIQAFQAGLALNQFAVPVAFAIVCSITAIAILKEWTLARWLGGLGGAVLILYALALVLLGTEDVGGPLVSVPAGLLLGAFGGWNVVSSLVEAG